MGISGKRDPTYINPDCTEELQIINISSYHLSVSEMTLLKKGLSFTPIPKFNVFNWVKDVNLFARKLALKKLHMSLNTDTRSLIQREQEAINTLEQLQMESEQGVTYLKGPFSKLKPKSQFTPFFSQYANINTFVSMVSQDLRALKIRTQAINGNLTRDERIALDNLTKIIR